MLFTNDLYNVSLIGNIFKHNSSHSKRPVVDILNVPDITDAQLEGDHKRSLIIRNNLFEENGSHGPGVL